MTHQINQLTIDDGTTVISLQPPDFTEMSYDFAPVQLSSIFEAVDGSAIKQVNAGSARKRTVVIRGQSICALPFSSLLENVTWTVTLIDPEALNGSLQIVGWVRHSSQVPIQVNARTARRSWSIEIREK